MKRGQRKIKVELEITLDKPLDGTAEQERYLCASLEEGIELGWFDFLMNETQVPDVKSVVARLRK